MAASRNKEISCGPRVWGIASLNCVANASSEAMEEKSLASAAALGTAASAGNACNSRLWNFQGGKFYIVLRSYRMTRD